MIEHLGSAVDRPVLRGLRPDLYRCFMDRTWRSGSTQGVVGLIHPDSHFTEKRAAELRRNVYSRIRRHFQFRNELKLFEVDNHQVFGIHVYKQPRTEVDFDSVASVYHPDTVDRSYLHDGTGARPELKDDQDNWDRRPHRERIVRVNNHVLKQWAALVEDPGTPAVEARMLYPVNHSSSRVLQKIAEAPRFGSYKYMWTQGWNESNARRAGYFEARSAIAPRWTDVILQGPHFSIGTPVAKEPNETMRSNKDFSRLDLERLGEDDIPRTSYQRALPFNEYQAGYPKWNDQPSSAFFRLAWREMAQPSSERSLFAALMPPGPTHVHAVHTLAILEHHDILARLAGFSHSLVLDFFIKVLGTGHVKGGMWSKFPYLAGALDSALLLRTLRLNCLVRAYAPLWEELFDNDWQTDRWAPGVGLDPAINTDKPALADVKSTWWWHTPLRRDADRRQALVEIDAIVAVMLDITADELVTIYRTQFPVLQKYEREALYDAHGRQVPRELAKEHRKHGGNLPPQELTVDGKTYALPFLTVDRERDYRAAHEHFSRLAREGAP